MVFLYELEVVVLWIIRKELLSLVVVDVDGKGKDTRRYPTMQMSFNQKSSWTGTGKKQEQGYVDVGSM